ncbi:MAG: hypothetical protein K1X35_08485 [Caulobacteraceae bacterium]|nr:hypothetical protein [Caulobacteraceae bacterium]
MNPIKPAALAALALLATAAPAALAKERPLETYYAELGRWDHFNSNGERLRTAAAIIRQDRANYHKFHRRDVGDQGDSFFRSAENRARLEAMLNRGDSDPGVLDRIINGTPIIRVDVYRDYVEVTVD